MNKIICTDVIKDGDAPMYIVKVYDLNTPVNFHSYDCLFFKQGRSIDELLREAKQCSEETVPADLEEAANKYAEDNTWVNEFTNDGEIPEWYKHTAEVFKAGASWQNEQMMKEAVEGYISATNEVSAVLALPKGDFKKGDKGKLLFVKED